MRTTLLNDLDAVDGTYGIEAMCVAGGQADAMIVERANLAPPGGPTRREELTA